MRLYELPISFLCRITAREAPSVPPSTVSFRRLRRALVRKICSFSSLTFFSSERKRTELAASPLAADPLAGAAPGSEAALGTGAPAGEACTDVVEAAGPAEGDAGAGAATALAGAACASAG